MAKKSNAGLTTLLVLGLVLPLGVANFLLNIVLTIMYLPSLSAYMTPDVDTIIRIFVPFGLYVLALIFSVLVLTSKKNKDHTLAVLAVVLNAVLIVSGLFFIYTSYFA